MNETALKVLKKINGSKLWQFLFPKLAKKKVFVIKSKL